MFRKQEEINDLIDISLVNPDEEKRTNFFLVWKILVDSFNNLIFLLVITLFDNLSLMFISRENNANSFICLQFSLSIVYIILLSFSTGIIQILVSQGKPRKLYYESFSIIVIFVLIIYLPLSLLSYFIAPEVAWTNFISLSSFYVFLKLVFFLNLKLMEIRKMKDLAALLLIIFSIFQISLSYLLVVVANKSIFGVYLALLISYFIGTISTFIILRIRTKLFVLELSSYLLYKECEAEPWLKREDNNFLVDYEDEKTAISPLMSFYLNTKFAIITLFYFSDQERSSINKNQEENFSYFELVDHISNKFNHHDRNVYKSLRRKSSHKNSEEFDKVVKVGDADEPLLNPDLKEKENIDFINSSREAKKRHFSIKLALELFALIFKISALSLLNYLGFCIIVVVGYHLETPEEQVTNIILINILAIPFIVCYSFSQTLTNYISLESFTHSYNNKFKFTKICSLTLLVFCFILAMIFMYYPDKIASWYYDTKIVKDHVEHITRLYTYFIFPHFASIMLDNFIITASEENYISYLLSGLFSLLIIPITLALYYLGLSYLICWYGFFIYNILHLITLILFLLAHKVVI